MIDKIKKIPKIFSALALLTILIFWRVIIAGYVQWDDPVFILNNALLREPLAAFLPQIFSHYFFGDYLPMTLISFWAEFQLWGAQPEPQHILNLSLHLLNMALLCAYLLKLPIPRGAVLFMTAVFAIHPLQTEVVMWISERKSLLALFFALLAMHAAQKDSSKNPLSLSWFAYILFFCSSLLSKSTALFLPLLLISSDLLFFKISYRTFLKKHFLPLTLAVAWGAIRIFAYSQAVNNSASVTWNLERIRHLPDQIFVALGFYLEKFFIPVGLSAIYPPYTSFQNTFWFVFAILFFAGFTFYGFWRKNSLVIYFLILITLFLLPILQIVPRINFVSDRYMYFPVIGLAGLCTIVAPSFLRPMKISGIVILILGFLTYQRTEVWTSDLNLWTDTVKKNPQSSLAQNNLGLALLKENQTTSAISYFERASLLGVNDGTAQLAFHNLGLIYSSPKWPDLTNAKMAEAYYLKSIETAPKDSAESKYNLGLLYAQTQRTPEALALLQSLEQELSIRSDQRNLGLLMMTKKILSQLKNNP